MIATILTGILLTLAFQVAEPPLIPPPGIDPTGVTQPETTAGLDGRTLIVRRYADWQNAPGEFELLRLRIERGQATVEPGGAAVAPFAVIVSEDQEDEAVKRVIGDTLWARSLTEPVDVRLPLVPAQIRQGRRWQFTDALGEPLPGAAVEIWLADYRGPRIRFARTTLDAAGELAWKAPWGNPHIAHFVVSHPDYGGAEVREPFEPERTIIAPLVRRGTVAAERAIHGRVVDPDGAPVAGATIDCWNVRTLGEGLISNAGQVGKGITDANGAFSFYLPNRKVRDDRGELIPPKSQYQVRIKAPQALGLLPYAEPIENGRDSLVVLERGDHVRRLRFEDPNGTITDPKKLQTISLRLQRPGRSILMLGYDDWKDGAALVPGVYEASMQSPGAECLFEPVKITPDSPEEVVFRLPAPVTYYGRVVHGITGRSMPGAFVLAMTSSAGGRLCELTPTQWDALHALTGEISSDAAALKPLRAIHGFTKLVRTNATGGYGIALKADESFYGFVAFEQDYLAVMYRRHALQAGADHFAEVPTIKLFPAATVFVETTVDSKYLSIMPQWDIDKATQPAWVEELLGIDNGRESALEYHDWVEPNARRPIAVPAGVNLRLRLDTPHNDEFCPLEIPQPIFLRQGETADLGQFTFEPAIAVQVKAVDSTGRPLEGIPIRKLFIDDHGMRGWSVPHITDEQGIARFHVVPNSTGSFGVLYHDDSGFFLKETLDYTVAGREDTGREFVLRLSDEMLVHLLE